MKESLTLVAVLCWLALFPATAQDSTHVADTTRKASFVGIPIVYFTPETQWAGGVAGVYTFRLDEPPHGDPASQLQFGAAYTQLKQLLLYISGRVYWGEHQNIAYGEVGYYIYNYFYYGVGNQAPDNLEELYGVTYPRIRLNYLRQVNDKWSWGPRYWFDGYRITQTTPGGALAADTVVGSKGGVVSGLGLVANYDSRDNIFWPSEGAFLEASALVNSPWLGSSFTYTRWSLDASYFYALPWGHRIAGNSWTEFTFGDTPFYDMPVIGGTKKMRGYYQGRFRDKHMSMLQLEYRAPLFWRIGLVGFTGIGVVGHSLGDLANAPLRSTYGLGARIMYDRTNQVNLRVDVGFGPESKGPAFYLTVGEAF